MRRLLGPPAASSPLNTLVSGPQRRDHLLATPWPFRRVLGTVLPERLYRAPGQHQYSRPPKLTVHLVACGGGALMEDAAARKARLKRLREEADATEAAVPAALEEPKLKFRNYAPRDEKIEHEVVAQPEVKDFEAPQIEPEQPGDEGELLVNVAPKKPNWDLRRDIAKKLAKLERRTQKAMIQIMKEQERARLEAEGGQVD